VAPPRRRGLTETDRAEWSAFTRTIRPLRGTRPKAKSKTSEPEPARPEPPRPSTSPARPARARAPAQALSVGNQPGGLDTASWNRLRGGKLPPERTLDLHGRTAQRAFRALETFLHTAHADQVRCVEIITGRGQGETGGVLKRELPLWLNLPTLRPLVLAATYPHPANPGAVRLLIRRTR
jgi:DNA-nicking Smr family endonuclease